MQPKVFDWKTIPAVEVRPGVNRKVFTGEGAMLVVTEVAPGSQEAPHTHPFEQLVHVLEGKVRFTFGEEALALGPGSVLRVPAGTPHGARVEGETPGRLLAIYGPPREDYLAQCAYQRGEA